MKIILTSAIAALAFSIPVQAQNVTAAAPDPCSDTKVQLAQAQSSLNDWPDLNRYREANRKLPPPDNNENRVVFLGDSITDSWSDPRFGGFFPEKPYVNRGISGQTTPQMLIRFRPDVISLKPRVVVILAGTNDIAGNTGPVTLEFIEGNLMTIAELARQNGIRVILASVLPVSDHEVRDGKPIFQTEKRPPEKIRTLNEWVKNYAAANRLVYLDYFSAMVDEKGFLKDEFTNDGLHPNERGYAVMAPLVEQAIARALKD